MLRWRGGRDALRDETRTLVEALLRDDPSVSILRAKPGRRRIATGSLASGVRCVVKHYAPRRQAGPGARLLSALGFSTAARERIHLARLARCDVPAPDLLAHWEAPDGSELLVLRHIEGESLHAALAHSKDRRALLQAVGRLVARLHASGHVHRDLHGENVWVGDDGPVLLDLQELLPLRWSTFVWRDRGELDASLASQLSLVERTTLRMALLGVERPFDTEDRQQLRQLARAGAARRRAHVVSRTQRSLRPGRLYARLETSAGAGLRWRESDEARIRRALDAPSPEASLAVRHYEARSQGEAMRWRRHGSPARRAWVASHGLRSRGIAAPHALAFAESDGPFPRRAWLVLDDAAPARSPVSAEAIVRLALHARRDGVLHDAWSNEPWTEARLERLEQIHFAPRRGGDAPDALDACIEAQLANEPSALDRYRAAKRFQVFP